MKIRKANDNSEQPDSIGARPEFYLIYLAFYFFPWWFKTPTINDIIAIVVALIIFVPINLHGHRQTGTNSVPHIIVTSLIGFAVSPFLGSHGVFHIYAIVHAGFVRPERHAWIGIILLSIIFSAFSMITNQSTWDFVFALVMGLIVAIGSISTASQKEQNQVLEQTRELDQQLAAVEERERIARDLHDLLGQSLTLVALKSEVAIKLFDSKPEQAKIEINQIREAARDALSDVRETISGMNATTIEAELSRAKQVLSSANIELSIYGAIPKLNEQANQVLGLTLREAMTNIVRHSRANKAKITFEQSDRSLNLLVEDNGVTGQGISESDGLRGLRKRVRSLGGDTTFTKSPHMTVSIKIPNWRSFR